MSHGNSKNPGFLQVCRLSAAAATLDRDDRAAGAALCTQQKTPPVFWSSGVYF
jgi:hypothetical protein